MIGLRGRKVIGAYVCPRGVYVVEARRSALGLEVTRSFDVAADIQTASDAGDQLVRVLASAGLRRADVSIALRGFGVVHHMLQLPPAADSILAPIVDREIRRLEPELVAPSFSWQQVSIPGDGEIDSLPAYFVAAAPDETIQPIEKSLRAAGHRLTHLTALPASVLRLEEEFDDDREPTALVMPLPDGPFLGFTIGGTIRLIVEPPAQDDADGEHAATALAEEVELGAMFLRQQFRGTDVARAVLLGREEDLVGFDAAIRDRLGLPVAQFPVRELSPSSLVALGALLDSQAKRPLALGGLSRRRRAVEETSVIRTAGLIAVGVAAVLALWTVTETVRARSAAANLVTATRRIDQDAFGLAPSRATADQRRLVRDAHAALRAASLERSELQQTLAGVASAVGGAFRLDSIALDRGADRWKIAVGGTVERATGARAVQALDDFYRELPRRLTLEALDLHRLSYGDSIQAGVNAIVHFELTFDVPSRSKP